MTRPVFFCCMGLFLLSFATRGGAERQQQTIAQQKSTKSKKAAKRKRSLGRKVRSKRVTAHNLLYPFTLRVLYQPSYRFLTKDMSDAIYEDKQHEPTIEVVQFLPIAVGLEGEFAFNKWLSWAVEGGFSWQNDTFTLKDGIYFDYHEFVLGSTLYVVNDYFKLGSGLGLTFANMMTDASGSEDGKKLEVSMKTT